jgi:hypothetical protein
MAASSRSVRAWPALHRVLAGEYLDLYLIMVVALAFSILGLFEIASVARLVSRGRLAGTCRCWHGGGMLANRSGDGSLPSGKDIGLQHDRHERWGRLVKRAHSLAIWYAARGEHEALAWAQRIVDTSNRLRKPVLRHLIEAVEKRENQARVHHGSKTVNSCLFVPGSVGEEVIIERQPRYQPLVEALASGIPRSQRYQYRYLAAGRALGQQV